MTGVGQRLDLPQAKPVARLLDLVDPASQELYGRSLEEARAILARGDAAGIRGLRGSFALVARQGEKVLMARSLERPLRYFLAKEKDGPMLIVAARLKAFTLAAGGGGGDLEQAREFLRRTGLELFHESVELPAEAVDCRQAIALIEDYKPLDVECAAVTAALLGALRERYPEWKLLADGDGGDENLKDYPIEENPELTIRSVVNNSMLYQEGWGVEAVKHSLTYSGGLSRGSVRSWAPARHFGFRSFSPFKRPALVEVAESIPFAQLTGGSHQVLYGLKGQLVARGFRRLLGIDFPVFPKRRFQHGALPEERRAERFAASAQSYRRHFLELFAG